MHLRVMVFMFGTLVAGALQGGWAPAALAGSDARHDGVVEAVDVQVRKLTLSELAAAGAKQTLKLEVSPDARIVRSEPLPADQVTDLERPFKDTPIDLADIRPGDFVVVELPGAAKDAAVRFVMVTLGSTSTPSGQPAAPAR
jgi:hypothetical protein